MKKFLLKNVFAIVLLTLIGGTAAFGQAACTPDGSITSPGIYPDPLPDGCVGSAYSEKVDFVFPSDTTVDVPIIGPVTVPFDSFVVSAVLNIPAGLSYECDMAPSCTYITSPPALTRGCVQISGTPTAATLPTDSVEVIGEAWVTIVGTPQSFVDTLRIGLLIENCTSTDDALRALLDLNVYPNPVNASSVVEFNLVEAADAKVSVVDLYGREVSSLLDVTNKIGRYQINLNEHTENMAPGVYFVKVSLNGGAHIFTEKVILTK